MPKGVKLNIKQFSTFQERKIICKTHRSILNSRVRGCNRIIKKLETHIDKIKSNIKGKLNNKDFKDIVEVIHKSREKVFKTTKNRQIKKFHHLQQQPRYRNTPVPDVIRKKWVINLSSKPLSDGEQSILQKGPKFAVSSSKVPITEYIAVTKRICDELGENTTGKDCTEIYQKTKEVLQHFKEKKGPTRNITRQEKEAIKTLREDSSRVVLTADKGVALVVMDKNQYVEKCMDLLNDTKTYQPCKDTTKKLHRDVQESLRKLNREHGTSRLHDWSKLYYNRLLPTGNSSPAPRFYGLPKIHKTNCPMRPIVSACGTATYQLAKFLTKILQRYTGITPSFVKDSKSFSDHLRTVKISGEEELVSFDVSALFTSIPVPTALDVINRLFTEHIEDPEAKDKYGCSFRRNTIGLEKDEVMSLLKLVLENCVFTFQDRFYKQLHGAAMGSPCSPVVANIYMEYFENMALGPELPVPIKDWKRYVDDVFSIIPKGNRVILLQYLNSIDPHIKFTIEQPNAEGGIPFLDTFPKPKGEEIAVAVYRKPTHTDRYLDFNSSHPVSAKRAVVRALMDRAENVCSDPEILANEIDHLNKVLHYNNYPQWMIKQRGKMEKQDPLIHPETGNEIQKRFYISVPYFPGLSESFKKIFKYTPVQVCFKGVNTLKSMLMHPKDKVPNDQKKDLVYHWECKADGCKSSYIGETSRALGERVKEHSKSTTSAILKHCKDFHHPLPSINDFSIVDKDPSQVTREAKEAIHIRRLDPSLNRNIGKMSIPHCFDNLLGAKPKHPRVGELSVAPSVEEVAPPTQIPGINLTQFNNIGNFRPNVAIHIPRHSTRACRARNLFN